MKLPSWLGGRSASSRRGSRPHSEPESRPPSLFPPRPVPPPDESLQVSPPPEAAEPADEQQPATDALVPPGLSGWVDVFVAPRELVGWAFLPDDAALAIVATSEGREIGRARTDRNRGDLAMLRGGQVGFSIILAENFAPSAVGDIVVHVESAGQVVGTLPASEALLAQIKGELPPDELRGCVDQVRLPYEIYGWACITGSPKSLEVRVYREGREIGRATAAILRPDLLAYGDGHHGFVIQLTEPLWRGVLDEVEVIALNDDCAIGALAFVPGL